MNINTTDKVQVGDSTAGTSTNTTWYCPYIQPRTEQGWECPRCGHINAPWVSQCNCSRNYWTITCNHLDVEPSWTGDKPGWWKEVTCNSDTFRVHPESVTYKTDVPETYTTKTYPNNICENH